MTIRTTTPTSVDDTLNHYLRPHKPFFRTIAAITMVAFLGLYLQPLAVAAQTLSNKTSPTKTESDESKLSKTILKIERQLERLEEKLEKNEDDTAEKEELKALRVQLDGLDQNALDGFAKVERYLKDKKLPETILKRHYDAVASYQAEMKALKGNLDELKKTKKYENRKATLKRAKKHLKAKQKRRKHQKIDPKNLPFRVPKGDVRKPATTKEEFKTLGLIQEKPIQVASTELSPLILAQATTDLPQPEHLQPTEDVQLTQAIIDKADELNNSPVDIYNWVRNNIEFLPTYGSIQGSDMTLQTKRGNAFDTSSLLIALLRAAGIPSRYVYGTVEIPIEKVMNWVGGVEVPEAALQLLGQGGIPSTGLVSGGKFVAVRMEHIWVEAWVDFIPSRGAKNIEGDTWIPLDGSFKQYDYVAGTNITELVSFNAQEYLSLVLDGATVEPDGTRVTNLNQVESDAILEQFQRDIVDEVFSQTDEPSQEEFLGQKNIQQLDRPILSAGLPYHTVAVADKNAAIQSPQRHYVDLRLFASSLDQSFGFPSLTYRVSFPEIVAGRLGITYVGATAADQAVLDEFRNGGSQTLPLYLIRVRPEIQFDGFAIATGPGMTMGTDQIWSISLDGPVGGQNPAVFDTIAGDEIVVGLNASGTLESFVSNQFQTKDHDSAAGNLHFVAQYYWMLADYTGKLVANQKDGVNYRLPSVGLFSSVLDVQYFFGLPRIGSYQARVVDIKHALDSVVKKNGENPKSIVAEQGIYLSFWEGAVLDYLFDYNLGSSISAVQLLQDANRNGSSVHHITQANLASSLPLLNISSEVKTDISNSVQAGLEAFVSDADVVKGAWRGTGYILRDTETGAGAYRISGGLDGSRGNPCPPPSAAPVRSSIVETFTKLAWAIAIAALVIAAILVAPTLGPVLALMMGMLGLASMPARASSGPLPNNLQIVWDSFFKPQFGEFPSNPPAHTEEIKSAACRAARKAYKAICSRKATRLCRNKNLSPEERSVGLTNHRECIAGRVDYMQQCGGGGDARHWDKVQNRLRGVDNCLCALTNP